MPKHPLTIVYRPHSNEAPPEKKFAAQTEHEIESKIAAPIASSTSNATLSTSQQSQAMAKSRTASIDEIIDVENFDDPVEPPKNEPAELFVPPEPETLETAVAKNEQEETKIEMPKLPQIEIPKLPGDNRNETTNPPASSSTENLSSAEIRSRLGARISHNLLDDCLNERSRLHGYGLSLKRALVDAVRSLASSRKFINNDLRKLHEDQDALGVEFEFQCREMQTAAKNHEASLAKERTRMADMHERDERRIFDAKAHANCCKDATREMKCETQVEVLKTAALERDLAACQQKLHDKIFVATNASCSKCKSSEKVRLMLEGKVVDLTRERDKAVAKLDTSRTELDKKERIVRILTKSTERAQFEAKSAKEHQQSEILLAIKRKEEEWTAAGSSRRRSDARDTTSASRTPGSAPNPSPPVSDASPCTTPRDGDTKPSAKSRKNAADATEMMESGEVEDGEEDAVDETDAEWLSSQLDGYKNICEWYRKEVKTLTDESNFYAAESETSLLRVDRMTEERQSTAKLSTALAASQAECEDLRRHLATLTDSVKAYIGVNGDGE